MKKLIIAGVLAITVATSVAYAEPAIMATVAGPASVGTIAAGGGVAVLAHEAFAKKPFGKNGEGARAVRSVCRGIGFRKC